MMLCQLVVFPRCDYKEESVALLMSVDTNESKAHVVVSRSEQCNKQDRFQKYAVKLRKLLLFH